jgi:hypothetical protein
MDGYYWDATRNVFELTFQESSPKEIIAKNAGNNTK